MNKIKLLGLLGVVIGGIMFYISLMSFNSINFSIALQGMIVMLFSGALYAVGNKMG